MQYRRRGAADYRFRQYYHPIEAATETEIRAVQETKLQSTMSYLATHSVLYQNKFAEAGIEFSAIQTIEDLEKVPFTVKQDLRDSLAAQPPFGQHQAAAYEDIVQLQASSGTTGSPAYVALTESDIVSWSEMSARGFFAGGIRPGDLVLHGFSMSKGFVGGIPCQQSLQYMGAIDIPIGADGGADRLLRACADLRPRAIIGTPNFLLYMAQLAPEVVGCQAHELGVERLVVGGEPGGGIPAVRNQIEEAWQAKVCEAMGGTDLGVIYRGECDEQDGMHMLCQDHIIVELIDPETSKVIPFEEGTTGELVYTAIGRQASPVVRFRSGDHIVVTGTSCACGRTGPKIRCFGRTDDMLIVRGVNVFPSAIQDIVVSMTPQTNGVMRVYADFDGHTTQKNLKVLVERGEQSNAKQDPELIAEVTTKIRNALAFKPEVIMVAPNTFEKPGVQKVALTVREKPPIPELE
ncbi:MAG: AMP-binding protein [Pseudomonadales bacterium]|nr:AMP-binding protein [Pseudomonadales bacterium]